MNEDRKYYCSILGLKPEATLDEIQKAYRQLGQIYHPDFDESMDTELMYREIRVAYEKLFDWHRHGKMDAGLVDNRDHLRRSVYTAENVSV